MYTRCPHCTTIFQITAEQLRAAHGDIPCVTCKQPFDAVQSLSDDVTTLMATPDVLSDSAVDDAAAPVDELIDDSESAPPSNTGESVPADDEQLVESMEFDAPEQSWTKFFVTDDEISSADPAGQDSAIETQADLPSPKPKREDGNGEPWISEPDAGTIEFQTDDPEEWQEFLVDLVEPDLTLVSDDGRQGETDEPDSLEIADWTPDEPRDVEPAKAEPVADELWNYDPGHYESADDASASDEPENIDHEDAEREGAEHEGECAATILPQWLADETPDHAPTPWHKSLAAWRALSTCAILIVALGGQLIHYNRDALASHATYGAAVRQVYDFFDAPLYPDWQLDTFSITGTEAIAGQSNQNALDILANVVVGGRQAVGLPLIRVVLRDRWSNPVASRVFDPAEYLQDFAGKNSLVDPGTAVPVEISVADPGAAALGYVIDVCLPRRKTGLECQIARDPFK